GWISPLLIRLVVDSPNAGNWTSADFLDDGILLTGDQSSWVVSLIELGNVVTPIPSGFLVNWTGRKWMALFPAPVFFLTWLLVLSTRSIPVLYAVRIVQGMAIGFAFTGVPMYIAEVAEPRLRGRLCTFVGFMWSLGILYQFCLGPYLSYQLYTWLTLAPTAVFMLTFFWFPRSPYQLLMKGESCQAAKSLAWFRGASGVEEVADELAKMKQSVFAEADRKAGWKDLIWTQEGRKALAILQLLAVLKVMTGGFVVQSYASQALSQVAEGKRPFSPHMGSILMSLLTLAVTLASGYFVDRLGRRPLLLVSSVATTICCLLAFAYFLAESLLQHDTPPFMAVLSFIAVVMSTSFSSFGLGTVSITLRSELFPNTTRGLAIGITSTVLTFISFLALKLHQVVADGVGLYLDFLIYALFGAVGTVCIFLFVPETKGKTFDEIQTILKR
ncbi:hypothetical protein AAG570_004767, partial [Ranatra chinensis]